MNKGTHFIGQPMYGQLISLLNKSKNLKISREKGGERYVKHFDAWQLLVIMSERTTEHRLPMSLRMST